MYTDDKNGAASDRAMMPPPVPPATLKQQSAAKSQSLGLKILFIAIISLVLLIPDMIIMSMTEDRQACQDATVTEISDSWSGRQLISGPIITVPYDSVSPDDAGGKVRLLPETMDFTADVRSQTLHRGIYESVVYNADVALTGTVSLEALRSLGIPMSAYRFDKAQVTVGVGDLKGVEEITPFSFGRQSLELEGGVNYQVYDAGGSSRYDIDEVVVDGYSSVSGAGSGCLESAVAIDAADSLTYDYALNMKLRGSQSIGVTPVGRRTSVAISGDCGTPSFNGMFLPAERTVATDTFAALWKLNSINRDYPQAFVGGKAGAITNSAVVVDMRIPVDRYQKTERAVKYAIVVILLTFIAVLFAEIMLRHPIHVFQYLLIGLALILFYSLLLSLSEHMPFWLSYMTASLMTIGLLTLYMKGVLKSTRVAASICGLLVVIYLFIYVLLCLETYALLAGSIGLFVALSAIMYATIRLRIENKA